MEKNMEFTIIYDSLWGHAFLSLRFARFLTHCFDLPVKREYKNDGVFEIRLNGRAIYSQKGEVDTSLNPLFLVDLLSDDVRPVREPGSESLPDDSKDPEYREWMQSFCSGE